MDKMDKNPVHKFMKANKTNLCISGQVYPDGGGRYMLENGSGYRWTQKHMHEYLSGGNKFTPQWYTVEE